MVEGTRTAWEQQGERIVVANGFQLKGSTHRLLEAFRLPGGYYGMLIGNEEKQHAVLGAYKEGRSRLRIPRTTPHLGIEREDVLALARKCFKSIACEERCGPTAYRMLDVEEAVGVEIRGSYTYRLARGWIAPEKLLVLVFSRRHNSKGEEEFFPFEFKYNWRRSSGEILVRNCNAYPPQLEKFWGTNCDRVVDKVFEKLALEGNSTEQFVCRPDLQRKNSRRKVGKQTLLLAPRFVYESSDGRLTISRILLSYDGQRGNRSVYLRFDAESSALRIEGAQCLGKGEVRSVRAFARAVIQAGGLKKPQGYRRESGFEKASNDHPMMLSCSSGPKQTKGYSTISRVYLRGLQKVRVVLETYSGHELLYRRCIAFDLRSSFCFEDLLSNFFDNDGDEYQAALRLFWTLHQKISRKYQLGDYLPS